MTSLVVALLTASSAFMALWPLTRWRRASAEPFPHGPLLFSPNGVEGVVLGRATSALTAPSRCRSRRGRHRGRQLPFGLLHA